MSSSLSAQSQAQSLRYFDTTFYLNSNPDVLAAVAAGRTTAFDHFANFGAKEGRSPAQLFNAGAYLISNPDVALAVGSGALHSAWDHFVNVGITEGRSIGNFSGTFNSVAYLAANPDVAAAVSGDNPSFRSAFEHFLLFGANEGRAAANTAGESITIISGQTFALTTDIDTITGTARNDLFRALVDGENNTLNPGDKIDGGAGRDTINVLSAAGNIDFRLALITNVERLEVDSRFEGSARNIFLGDTSFAEIDVDLNGVDRNRSVEISGLGVNSNVTVRNADMTDDHDVVFNFKSGTLNATINLRDLTDIDDIVVFHSGAESSVLTMFIDGVNFIDDIYVDDYLGTFNLTLNSAIVIDDIILEDGVGTFNLTVNGNARIDEIDTYSGYDNDNFVINLVLNADLNVGDWDLPDDSATTTTMNITGAGNLTIAGLDDDASTLTINAGSATGNIQIFDISSSLEVDTIVLGSGNDILEFAGGGNAGASITLGAGSDSLIFRGRINNLSEIEGDGALVLGAAISITDFNGAEDTIDLNVFGLVRLELTNVEQVAVSAAETFGEAFSLARDLASPVGLAFGVDGEFDGGYTVFQYDGNTYVFMEGEDFIGEDGFEFSGLVELTGFTGVLNDANFVGFTPGFAV